MVEGGRDPSLREGGLYCRLKTGPTRLTTLRYLTQYMQGHENTIKKHYIIKLS